MRGTWAIILIQPQSRSSMHILMLQPDAYWKAGTYRRMTTQSTEKRAHYLGSTPHYLAKTHPKFLSICLEHTNHHHHLTSHCTSHCTSHLFSNACYHPIVHPIYLAMHMLPSHCTSHLFSMLSLHNTIPFV